nr:hypothetical protein [Anaerolineae bacterium]
MPDQTNPIANNSPANDEQPPDRRLLGRLQGQRNTDQPQNDQPGAEPEKQQAINDLPFAAPFTSHPADISETTELAFSSDPLVDNPITAMALLEERMAAVTREFVVGEVNQAQFQTIFTHYSEQREIIARLASRQPDSDTWKRAATRGLTTLLRKRHMAELEGMAIFVNESGEIAAVLGTYDLPEELQPSLEIAITTGPQVQANRIDSHITQVEGGRWMILVRGRMVTTVALYSAEPSSIQLTQQEMAHREFEMLNQAPFKEGIFDADQLVFPQQTLFEQP